MRAEPSGYLKRHITSLLNRNISNYLNKEMAQELLAELAVWVADKMDTDNSEEYRKARARLGIPEKIFYEEPGFNGLFGPKETGEEE